MPASCSSASLSSCRQGNGDRWAAGGDGVVALLPACRETRRQTRLVAAGGVAMDDPLARHLVDERDGLLQRRLGAGQIVAVDRRAHALERVAQARAELTVVLAVLETLPMRLERGCMRSHVISSLRNS